MSCLSILLLLSFSLIYFLSKLPWAVFLCRTIERFGFEGNFKILSFYPPCCSPSHSLHSLAFMLFSCLSFWDSYCLDFLQFLSTLIPSSHIPLSYLNYKPCLSLQPPSWTLCICLSPELWLLLSSPFVSVEPLSSTSPTMWTCFLCTINLSIRNWGHFLVSF